MVFRKLYFVELDIKTFQDLFVGGDRGFFFGATIRELEKQADSTFNFYLFLNQTRCCFRVSSL